jgi:hypothetical protein
MVQSSGQFVFPKGTTADKPGASATSTLAAATVGAMRFNTTSLEFEGYDGTNRVVIEWSRALRKQAPARLT